MDPILRLLTLLMYCIGNLSAQLEAVSSIRQQSALELILCVSLALALTVLQLSYL